MFIAGTDKPDKMYNSTLTEKYVSTESGSENAILVKGLRNHSNSSQYLMVLTL